MVTARRYRTASDLRASWTGRHRGPDGQNVPTGLVRAIPAGRQAEFGAARATRTLTWAIAGRTENENCRVHMNAIGRPSSPGPLALECMLAAARDELSGMLVLRGKRHRQDGAA
jgi:hypothetical protein